MTLIISKQKYGKSLQTKVYLFNRVENIVAKGEITHYEQFRLLSQCFQKSSAAADASASGK